VFELLLTLATSSYGKGPLKIGITDTQYSDIVDYFKAFQGTGGAYPARDGNNGEAYGTSWYPNTMNPRTGERSHARNSYYDPVMSRSNLKVALQTVATELVFDGNKKLTAQGVKVTDKTTGATTTYYAKKEVILAAVRFGAIFLISFFGVNIC
jgi:choline dehydrogenase-like flavoprotein